MPIGSSSGWLMLAGMIMRAARDLVADELGRDLLALRDEGHLLGDEALAREVHLAHVRVAGARGLFLALYDPLGARLRDGVSIADGSAVAVRVTISVCAHWPELLKGGPPPLLSNEYTPRWGDRFVDTFALSIAVAKGEGHRIYL